MTIRNFDSIASIRTELKSLFVDCQRDTATFNSYRRLLTNKIKILAAKDDDFLTTRGPGAAGKTSSTPIKNTKKLAVSVVQKLTQLVSDRQEKYKLALYINALIKQNFENKLEDDEGGVVVKKLQTLCQELIKNTRKLYEDAEATLAQQGAQTAPAELKETVDYLTKSIQGEFEVPSSDIKVKYYTTVDTIKSSDNNVNRFIYMGYIQVNPFEANGVVRVLYIVVSTRQDSTGRSENYIRTFTDKVLPADVLKSNLGTKFDNNAKAYRLLVTSLKVDNIIDSVDPTQIPVKQSNLKYTNKYIMKNDVDEDNGVVTFYLNNSVKTAEKANEVMQDIFVETKKLIQAVHPRSKNVIRATTPRTKPVRVNVDGQSRRAERYFFKIMFNKPETGQRIELPRDRVKDFLKTLDIENADAARDFNELLKRYLNIHVKK